ncbi:uncharacterized protein DUF3558 [Pseudonocardia endophytica]|uniref:Uncharacterized protein DUF3558 n=1 Tax=Pseudonocardia endophytica TaxID=401976 RepID=A0A4V2PHH6_PSEEN|nr:uncharacterized protein DUF3558 [Pseudonocardia endophytica]
MFPPRPAEIDVQRTSACSMLSEEQQIRLELGGGKPSTRNVEGLPSPTCTWLSRKGVDFNIQLIPADPTAATQLPGAEVTQVDGFGAVQNAPAETMGGGPICQIAIDAAPGQTIRVQALTRTNPPPIPVDQLCQRATEAASMVMTTVVATASR